MPADRTLIKPRLPRGLADRDAGAIRATEAMVAKIRAVYERYGFEPVETPLIEYTEALGKFLPDQDRPNEGVFSFQDDDEAWLSLRYDLTAPLARYVAENYDRLPKPYRSYRHGWVFRNEKPGPGRFRQFMQFDADTVGAASPAADAEMCMMMADTLEALGIPRGQYVVKVNSRKILDGYMAKAGLAGQNNALKRLAVLRTIDKFDRLGPDAVRELLGRGRKDASGDWTEGAGLSNEQIAVFFDSMFTGSLTHYSPCEDEGYETGFLEIGGQRFVADYYGLDSLARDLATTDIGSDGASELSEMAAIFETARYRDRINIDPTVVRGLEYYTGPVFEAELLFPVPNEKGQPVVFGSVGGGGRYDGLVGRFMKDNVPATGFSIGVSRLQAALTVLGKLDAATARGPVVVTVMDGARLPDYQRFVTLLRSAKLEWPDGQPVGAELYLGKGKMGAQLKYADRRRAPCVIIQGDSEINRPDGVRVVQIKDLAAGKRLASAVEGHEQWKEERPGQVEVPEGELVAAVWKIVDAAGS